MGPPRRIDTAAVLAGLDTTEWLLASQVAKRINVSVNRATWMLNSLGSRAVERKEVSRPHGGEMQTRTVWRKK